MTEFSFNSSKNSVKSKVKVILTDTASINVGKFLKEEELKALKSAIKEGDFKGEYGKSVSVYDGKNHIILIGTGNKVVKLDIQTLGGKLYKQISKFEKVAFYINPMPKYKLTSSEIACNLAFGIEIGGYSFDKYFTKKGYFIV